MEVRLFSPRTGVAHVGRLIGTDAARQSFVAQVDDADVLAQPSSLIEAMLCVGGVPRQLTVQVQPIDRQHVRLIPLSPAKPVERRARKRYSVQIEAQLQVAETVLSVKVVNISVGGVGMRTPVAIEKGVQGILNNDANTNRASKVRYLPPSLRFPPLREGNRMGRVGSVPPACRGNLKEGVIGHTRFCELWLRDW